MWDTRTDAPQVIFGLNEVVNFYSITLPFNFKVFNYKNVLSKEFYKKSGSVSFNKTSIFTSTSNGYIHEYDIR